MFKWNPCGIDNSKAVYVGTKLPVSVSDENVQANRERGFFSAFVIISYHKKKVY